MYKKINLPVFGCLAIGLFITGCSQQPINASDVQPAPMVTPTPIDAQIQDVITPKAPVMVKPVQMAKPVQRMPKPIQRPIMLKPIQRMMSKPIQRQY